MQGTMKARSRSLANARATIEFARRHGKHPMRGRWQRFYTPELGERCISLKTLWMGAFRAT